MGDLSALMTFFGFGIISAYVGGLTGLGGGFLLIPLLTLVAQLDIKDAIFFSLSCILWLSILRMHKNRDYLRLHGNIIREFIFLIVAGSAVAAFVGTRTPSLILNKIFACIMLGGAIYFFLDRKNAVPKTERSQKATIIARGLFFSSGFLGGLLGIGGGIINVPTLHKVLRYPMHEATQLSFPFVFTSSITALIVYFNQRRDFVTQLSPLIMFALLAGTFVGSTLASKTKISSEKLKIAFASVIAIIGIFKLVSG